MPIIIWGSRGLTSDLEDGRFYCPRCDGEVRYRLKQVTPYFTLYFIPLFPMGSGQRYVECQICQGNFREEVLDLEPPSHDSSRDADKVLATIRRDLESGVSLEEVRGVLESRGLSPEGANTAISSATAGKDTFRCPDCGDHYLSSVKRCSRCR